MNVQNAFILTHFGTQFSKISLHAKRGVKGSGEATSYIPGVARPSARARSEKKSPSQTGTFLKRARSAGGKMRKGGCGGEGEGTNCTAHNSLSICIFTSLVTPLHKKIFLFEKIAMNQNF